MATGLTVTGKGYAHALHSPYWWLKCAVGTDRDAAVVRAYHRLLVWDITARPRLTRVLERGLNPVIGKSVVLYLRRDAVAAEQRPADEYPAEDRPAVDEAPASSRR
jgi:hypothetical protein